MRSPGHAWPWQDESGDATPPEFQVAAGAVAVACAAAVTPLLPNADLRYAVLVGTIAVFAAVTMRPLVSSTAAVIGFLIFNGFVTDREGQLRWHSADLARLELLLFAVALGVSVGEVVRLVHGWHERRVVARALRRHGDG